MPIGEDRWHTERDVELATVRTAIGTDGWSRSMGKYKSVKHELRTMDGAVTRIGETVVPGVLSPKVLAAAHAVHPGQPAMKSILRGSVWWPGILAHAENWASKIEATDLADEKRSAKNSSIKVGDKVSVSRQKKHKGHSSFDPTVFTVIGKRHGTLGLLSQLGGASPRA